MIEMPQMVVDLVNGGVDVTICKSLEYGVYFDLNLKAKSHMHLFKQDDKWFVAMRYDEVYEVEDIDDLRHYARLGMHGRDFINYQWAEFLLEK